MNFAVILLGSNDGNLLQNLQVARTSIRRTIGNIQLLSPIYETDPWGKTDQPVFLNQVLAIHTTRDAKAVMSQLLLIETEMGRERKEKWAKRLIDLDLLYFNDEVICQPGLDVPHPHLHERRFTLVPLAEILPGFIHPVFGKSNRELLRELSDNTSVRKFSVEHDAGKL